MLTLKRNIKYNSEPQLLNEYVYQYTGLFYKLYNNAELLEDKDFAKEMPAKKGQSIDFEFNRIPKKLQKDILLYLRKLKPLKKC